MANDGGGQVSHTGKSDREYSEWVERMGVGGSDPIPRRLRPTRRNTPTPSSEPSRPQRKRPLSMVTEGSLSVLCPLDVRVSPQMNKGTQRSPISYIF